MPRRAACAARSPCAPARATDASTAAPARAAADRTTGDRSFRSPPTMLGASLRRRPAARDGGSCPKETNRSAKNGSSTHWSDKHGTVASDPLSGFIPSRCGRPCRHSPIALATTQGRKALFLPARRRPTSCGGPFSSHTRQRCLRQGPWLRRALLFPHAPTMPTARPLAAAGRPRARARLPASHDDLHSIAAAVPVLDGALHDHVPRLRDLGRL